MDSEHSQILREEDLRRNCPISMQLLSIKNMFGTLRKIRLLNNNLNKNLAKKPNQWPSMQWVFGPDGLQDSQAHQKREVKSIQFSDQLNKNNITIKLILEIGYYHHSLELEIIYLVHMMLKHKPLLQKERCLILNQMDIGIMFMLVIAIRKFMLVFYLKMIIKLSILKLKLLIMF